MKKIVMVALAAIALCGLPAIAQTQDNNKAATECTGQCQNEKPGKDGKQFKGQKGQKDQRPDAFEGIQLTDQQKQQLDQLKANRKAKAEARKAEMKEAKKERKQNDSVRRASMNDRRREYLTEVKEILTPDQYVVFLENMVLAQPQGNPQGMRPQGPQAPGKGGKEGVRGNRMERRTGDGLAKGQRPQRGQKMQGAPAPAPDMKAE